MNRRHAELVYNALVRLRDANEAAEQQRALDAKRQVNKILFSVHA